ncbi:acetyl-CoA acetyltransferase [Corynebacterium glutamicum MT]|uniref:Acetyl-CoA acetyltransferase n=1 Tax=Corynebacterium glutamicum TaxID=1718 RepID=A0AB36IHR2_CORGT|nr:acetyl-CoA C-acetyltransferase [Corynebacterium glutamicum]AGN20583.1 acetyl-CoA acetyltransferase [Corynebacterium glutamicum SCgG1]AGN23608.1 acetyl-CoA acetyltransferase [Corynebacterium glutamicum SCgG2]EOA64019.1 acetyl-CoA acetyltransferase [Corynebacterium glutamicum MT]EPP39299.1 acetyl-CoA acetyltransferase [Corynebacterium glutamicum Z188]NII88991.1 acetyl-CoA C-acetyltransferase [Corynebacterium glutamicum]
MSSVKDNDAVIVSIARSPIGRAKKGSLTTLRADDMAAQMVDAALKQVPELDTHDIYDLMMGCGQPGGEAGFNIGRIVTEILGLDWIPATTVQRYCASSLQTSRMAFHAIKAGEGDAFISAGVEAVSRFDRGTSDSWPNTKNPRFNSAAKVTQRIAASEQNWVDPRENGNLPDAYISMGQTAENVAQYLRISREEQDEWAVLSQNRAEEAIKAGFFEREITPLTLPDGTVVAKDDGPRFGTTIEKVQGLKSVFRENGTVTAANACPLNDGAAAAVIVSGAKAKSLGLKPLARIVSTGVSSLSAEIMGLGPIKASQQALKHAGMSMEDIDLVEINEAFASQVIGCARELEIPVNKLNIHGGAIALGHPFGMTGVRITATLLNGLQSTDQQFGLETMCTAGGQGMAMVLERL